jgi:hypothetical protein
VAVNYDDMILINVDDHIIEPLDMFKNHLQKEYIDEAPDDEINKMTYQNACRGRQCLAE